ncbi:MAG: DUF4358 domain-containing protein [Blautia sp.]|nr:DUF4358 domain-containing protein [Blautia sp.]
MVVFLVLYLGWIYNSDNAKDVSMEDISFTMENISSVTEMQKRGKGDLQRYFSVMDTDTEGYFFYKDISPMSVNEVLIMKAASRDKAVSLLEAAEAHLESQENVFGAYGTDQMGLLSEASVESKGNYVWYMCGPDASTWRRAFTSLI